MSRTRIAAANAAIINKVRSNASLDYQSRIPVTTQANLAKTLATLQENPVYWNEFYDVLVQRIGLTLFRANSFENALKPFKTGAMAYGGVVQELAANLLKAKAYDPNDTNPFDTDKAEVVSTYHHVNRRDRYDLRLNEDMLEEAFVNEGALAAFINTLVSLPVESDEWDEYVIMRNLIKAVHDGEGMATVNIPNILESNDPEADGKKIASELRARYLRMKKFYNTEYNNAGLSVTSNDLVFLATPEFFGKFDVEVLAAAYNMGKAEFIADRTVTVDDFGVPGVDCALIDRDWFVCTDAKIASRTIQNPATLDLNYFYHHWGVYSASRVRNALLFSHSEQTNVGEKIAVRTVQSVTVTTEDPSASTKAPEPGAEIKLNVDVKYGSGPNDSSAYFVLTGMTAGAAAEGVWQVVLPDTGTYVDRMGVLHVSPTSTYTALTVTAVSTVDGTKSGNLEIKAG